MGLLIGLDTGGTYTDAVIFDDVEKRVLAKSKALTTHRDLAVGINQALAQLPIGKDVNADEISLVSISTTLATNALVEGHGTRAGLVMIGFEDKDLDRANLRATLGRDPVVFVPGGHNVHGKPLAFDCKQAVAEALGSLSDVSSFGIAGLFAVRNPEHEIALRDALIEASGKPVTCSHELSADLDGPRRALTTLLNARLIPLIDRLLRAVDEALKSHSVTSPVMVVRGDGSLVSAAFARQRPIETILSGPAASVVGARFLTGCDDAIVADIGGTTTDIALLDKGSPALDPHGATIGGLRTMVKAIAMRTHGLGGDSMVKLAGDRLHPEIMLGPERVVPLSLLAQRHGEPIRATLNHQLNEPFPDRMSGMFVWRETSEAATEVGLSPSELALLAQLPSTPEAASTALSGLSAFATLRSLINRGLAQISAVTPSDAQHALGLFDHWDRTAAELGLAVFARQKDAYGKPIATEVPVLAQMIVDRVIHLSAERCLETALGDAGPELAGSALAQRALARKADIARFSIQLDRPVIGLGAGAAAYYRQVGDRLGGQALVPDHADVANAIGAVAGQVRISVRLELAPNSDGGVRIMGGDIPAEERNQPDLETSIATARDLAHRLALQSAMEAGAGHAEVRLSEMLNIVEIDGQPQFVDGAITAEALGRPSSVGR
ncbi:MAG: hydantoinase/oxoprolinase family protein [Pseudomonadota bacterium]